MSVWLDMSAAQMLRLGRDVLFALCLMVELVFGRVMPAHALEQVPLQLKWKHQFQFAGYYAAVEKGFYRDNGLDVSVREGGLGVDAGLELAKGALARKEEIVDLIRRKSSAQKIRKALLFEAVRTESLIEPHLTPIGQQSAARGNAIARAYVDLGALAEAQLPEGRIYASDDQSWRSRMRDPTVWAFLAIIVAILLGGILARRIARAIGALRLSAAMAGMFVLLSIPALIFILAYNYWQNSATIKATLNDVVAKTKRASMDDARGLINPVAATLELLASFAAQDPETFKKEESRDLLYKTLASAPQIDAVYVSLEDGYHRVVTRIDDDRRRSDPKIPATANWHSGYIDSFSGSPRRVRHRTFYDTWPHVVGSYDVGTIEDIRALAGYQAAKDARALIIEGPRPNPDTGFPVIILRVPIVKDDAFVGCASANITLNVLSQFLTSHRASPHSTTVIANPTEGTIIAHPDPKKGVRLENDRLEMAKLDTIDDSNVREAYRLQKDTSRDDFLFRSPQGGEEISASFTRFPGSFGKPWEVVTLTPTDDFIGTLKRTNRQMVALIAALTGIELLLIHFFSRRLSRPIECVSQDLRSVEDLTFSHGGATPSKIKEIKELQTAVKLFETSLRSFSSFVPLGIVRNLIKTGTPLTLGVEQRFMTVLFTDLKDFSTLSEQMAPNDLLAQLSHYFEVVSHAIAEESGTVDKFIGDGIMAFWGAPVHRDDDVLRGCCGAMRATRRMEQLNADWSKQGRPSLHLRIGLHCAEVLVGNVGSSERLSYTVMGDGVNVAARLEGINKNFGTTICISDSVVEAVGPEIVARPIRKVQVKGRKREFMIYELLGIKASDDPELKASVNAARLCDLTWDASLHFERGEFDQAARCYEGILTAFPDDPVAKSLLAMCSAKASA
ncbi:adenylate/guanylate cyclase domain-containing protein [Bradyrhizobium neotropicale]|uniref:adenylate/guanylate cyclase domain-containing protein n=1 Tax=Bradyrhizobium neotropicale TaxID=1497615 RepID=UPI001AD7707C|nr:adenylate/guanylate cyclase domain-containing protein [Bradyrhizobium neotropicale]MBO4227178.1 ABC transporter substrate-binding protein [Bradyrhizobium neotropicale]